MPLQRRIPKRGFTPHKRKVFQIVNVGDLARVEGTTVNAQTLRDAGLIRSIQGLIKVLAMGDLSGAYQVEAHKFSGGAVAKIEAAGGSVTTVGPVARAEPAVTAEPEAADEPKAAAEPEAAAEPQVAAEPEAAAESDAEAESETEAEAEADDETEIAAEPEPEAESEEETENDG